MVPVIVGLRLLLWGPHWVYSGLPRYYTDADRWRNVIVVMFVSVQLDNCTELLFEQHYYVRAGIACKGCVFLRIELGPGYLGFRM